MAHEWSIIKGSFLPLGVLLVVGAVGASVTVGVTAALISAAVLLVILETNAAVRTRRPGTNIFSHVAVGTILGLGILGSKSCSISHPQQAVFGVSTGVAVIASFDRSLDRVPTVHCIEPPPV